MLRTSFISIALFVFLSQTFVDCAANENDKIVRPKAKIESKCLDLLLNTNKTQLERCEFFKCFEERFPCGTKYWVLNWGYKYCRRYANKQFTDKFSQEGKQMLTHLNKCLPSKLEKLYKSKRPVRCQNLSDNMFGVQANCYEEILPTFCKAFPDNKNLLMNIMDQSDMMNMNSFSMIKKLGDKCVPKLDLYN
jgi:hypothetical protein